ncbi:MAG: redoxin domain-containing protein [Thermoanaerobaculia bacterium]
MLPTAAHLAVLALAILAAGAPGSRVQPEAIEILRRTSETYRSATSYQFEAIDAGPQGRGGSFGVGVFAHVQPDRWRIDDSLTVDGQWTWKYRSYSLRGSSKEYKYFAKIAAIPLSVASGPAWKFARIAENVMAAKRLREESLQIGAEKVECDVLEVEHDPTDESWPPVPATFWIEKKSALVRRFVYSGEMLGPAENASKSARAVQIRVDLTYHIASVNEAVPDGLFAFSVPKGAEEVEDGQPPFAKPFGKEDELTGREAPSFTLPDLDGKDFDSTSLRGRAVLLHFWASWCKPCQEHLRAIERLHRQFRHRGLVVLGVSLEKSGEAAREFLKQNDYTFGSLWDREGKTPPLYGAGAIPAAALIDRNGKVSSHFVGAKTEKELAKALKEIGIK